MLNDKRNLATANKSLDLAFYDISYVTGKGKNGKQILHKLSGTFKSGQLTAILGPSGAGKTSLMNILAGLKSKGVEGRVEVNGVERNLKTFRKHSTYIMQKDHLLSQFSIDEYMMVAAHLKLGNDVSNEEKILIIENVMKILGLIDSRRTRISYLSGGECKRLSIGLELIDNPAILFLDEPTSGLDSTSSLQCIAVLRDIASRGRTVITTIHQPSSRVLDHFDHLYIVAGGSCMYQGDVASLVPFFQTMNLNCPNYHNPVDFAMDVACGDHGDVISELVIATQNGRLIYGNDSTPPSPTQSLQEIRCHDIKSFNGDESVNTINACSKKKEISYGAPFHTQFSILFGRTWKTILREKVLFRGRIIFHVFMAVLMGMLYWRLGDDASVILNNASLLFFNILLMLLVSMMPTVSTFPLERQVLIREHLNHWYSLKAYYLAKTFADIPFQMFLATMYIVIVYGMSYQPMSVVHFFMLIGMTNCMALVGQGIGFFFGAAFDLQIAIFLAPTCSIPFVVICSFCFNLNSLPYYLSWITNISFMHHGFDGSLLSVYGYDRPPLSCSEPFCYFRYPQKFLKQFNLHESSYVWPFIGMVVIFLFLRVAAYLVLRFKLRHVR